MVRLPAELGGHALHCLTRGAGAAGAPTVVFDAALGASALSWTLVQEEVARRAATFAFDRAGMGWSELGPLPRSGERAVAELRALLAAAGARPPFLLVGHSYGGLLSRLFAARHPDEVAGLVLVDAAAPEQWTAISARDRLRLRVGRLLCRRGLWAARFGLARAVARLAMGRRAPSPDDAAEDAAAAENAATGPRGAEPVNNSAASAAPPAAAPGARGGGHERAARAVVAALTLGILGPRHRDEEEAKGERHGDRGLLTPAYHLPPAMRRPLATLWIQPKFYAALASQIESLPALARAVTAAERPLRGPVLALSASDPTPARVAEQERAVALSPAGRHEVVAACGHWIPLERPEAVIAAIDSALALAPSSAAAPAE